MMSIAHTYQDIQPLQAPIITARITAILTAYRLITAQDFFRSAGIRAAAIIIAQGHLQDHLGQGRQDAGKF